MQSLVDKFLNMEYLSGSKIKQISYLTGLSLENLEKEIDLGNFLITQIKNGKWVFLSEDKVGEEISFFEFEAILIANRFLKDSKIDIKYQEQKRDLEKMWDRYRNLNHDQEDKPDFLEFCAGEGLKNDAKMIEEMDNRVHFMIMDQIRCAGMEGYNTERAIQDALRSIAYQTVDSGFRIAEAAKGAKDSVQRMSEMMNILKKQETVDKISAKHLGPKAIGMNLKRNQKRR
jgi:hypothetical protein